MSRPLEGRTALVVGGSGGIGAATVRLLAARGARVAFTHTPRSQAKAQALLAGLPDAGHTMHLADVADTPSLLALRDAIAGPFGGMLNVLVNTAGFTKPVPHGDLDALDDALIDEMFAVNWRGQYAAIRTMAPLLKASGDGVIVSVSSIAGMNGAGSSIVYGATKAATDVMTKSLARVLAPTVRVMGVAPGVVDTGFVPGRDAAFNAKAAAGIPLGRVAQPEDVADAILACVTGLRYCTGSTLVLDGGRLL